MQNRLQNSKILLSLIVPAFNCEPYIRECLDSALSQLPEDCELIVTDDGSGDGTRDVLRIYEGRQKNLKIYYEQHQGASGARNAGLDKAEGEYVAFMDCDDCLKEGLLKKCLSLLESRADLYIFGLERVLLDGSRDEKKLDDREYPDASDFADDYIRRREFLFYSNCNKFYKRSIIEALGLRFDESLSFGEDRMFNYQFLPSCRRVVTSSFVMYKYMQRSLTSLSSRYIPHYFDIVMKLHEAKMECFLPLSNGTTEAEKKDFEAYDREAEIRKTTARFAAYPEEAEENAPKIEAFRAMSRADL